MTMQIFKTEGAPIKSCQGRRILDFEKFEKAVNKDLHYTWIGGNKITWNVPHNTSINWSREETMNHNDEAGLVFDNRINGDKKERPYIREDGTIGTVVAHRPKYPVWDTAKAAWYEADKKVQEKRNKEGVQVATFEIPPIERDYVRLPSMGFEAEYKVEQIPACQIPTHVKECEDGDATITASVAYPEPIIELHDKAWHDCNDEKIQDPLVDVHDVESSEYVGHGGNCRDGQFHVTVATGTGTAMSAQTYQIPAPDGTVPVPRPGSPGGTVWRQSFTTTTTAGTTPLVWNDGSYTGTTQWTEAYTTTGNFVLNFGPCQWPQHEGGDTCPSFRMNPVYSYCPTHMNQWYFKIGCDPVTWIVNQDGIAVSQERNEHLRRLSPEELAERQRIYNSPEAEARRNQIRLEAERRRELENVGELKATELLKSWLSEAEWNYLQEHNQLELPSQYEKDTIYIVKRDSMNRKIIRRVKGVDTEELCIHAGGIYARDDDVLAQILMIKAQEEEFLKVAVKYPLVKSA